MTHDPEASWPLTQTDPGYYPSTNPAPAPPSNLTPYAQTQYPSAHIPSSGPKPMSPGIRLAYLAVILGAAIPLTAIAGEIMGLIGLAICWVGIVLVAGFAFRNR